MPDPVSTAAALFVLRAIAPKAIETISSALHIGSDKVSARFSSSFTGHLEVTYNRCVKVRTIFSNDGYVPLSSIYVNLTLASDGRICRDEDLALNDSNLGNVVVVGTGGAGKTMLMRHVALMLYAEPTGRLPLFIELRNLPKHDPRDFYKTIFEMITPERDHDSLSVFIEGLRAGVFVLLLDGLDEVPPDRREDVFRSIQRIPLDFPLARILASTRPEIDVRPWEQFSAYKVRGLSLDQAKLLVNKIDYPKDLKDKFIALLTTDFFRRHETFLSVPLLCTLMLLTFNDFHEVPSRVTVFYEQAFETLYRRHDVAKEGFFKRTFATNISSDRFKSVFAAFCYRTLALNEVSFTDEKLRLHIAKASEVTEIEIDVDDYAADLVSSVCMIMRDGLNLHFIHRSFQDYFAALYILRYRGADVFDVYDRVITDSFISNIVEMAADIDLQTLEREWALPAVTNIDSTIKKNSKSKRSEFLLKKTFYELRVSGDPIDTISGWSWTLDQTFMKPLQALGRLYPNHRNIVPSSTFHGKLTLHDKGICALLEDGVELPRELANYCSTGIMPGPEEEYIEIRIENMPFAWLEYTPLLKKLEDAISSISELKTQLRNRVSARDKLSILS